MAENAEVSEELDPHRPEVWSLWVDTGGTFTDCVAIDDQGRTLRAKVLSSSTIRGRSEWRGSKSILGISESWPLPQDFFSGAALRPLGGSEQPSTEIRHYDREQKHFVVRSELGDEWQSSPPFEISAGVEAPVLAAHWVTGTPLSRELPPIVMRLATTRGTNALLERKGTPPVLFVTRGFADLLEIGNQQRPDLFALRVVKPQPLYEDVIEVPERLDKEGSIVDPLDLNGLEDRIERALQGGHRTAAVALLHSYRNGQHEESLRDFLHGRGFTHVSCSAELAPRIKIVPRAETAVVNAYLAETINRYLDRIRDSLGSKRLRVLTSAGGLVGADQYRPKDSLLSGPAGGVVGAAGVAEESEFTKSIAFDMGGTSTDVSRYDGAFDYTFETTVGGARLLVPSLAIETVAAGGGSICHFDGRQLKVGPQSAGADPGPACYGAGGPLTLTDVNLLLGRLDPRGFEIPVDLAASEKAAHGLCARVYGDSDDPPDRQNMLLGFLAIANERMAEAIRRISIRKGYDPAEFALVAFGGAGGQHACELAQILDIRSVLVPLDASLLSAVGLGRARVERFSERQVLLRLEAAEDHLEMWLEELAKEATQQLSREGIEDEEMEIRRRLLFLRLLGQETTLELEYAADAPVREMFYGAYENEYGFSAGSAAVELESIRVVAASRSTFHAVKAKQFTPHDAYSTGTSTACMDGEWLEIKRFLRSDLSPGARLAGPALILERHSSTVVPKGWTGIVDDSETLVLRSQIGACGSAGREVSQGE